ncbi:MAG TPA: pentapeptide repeat-containing protein [Solirubrobacterales bacterium]|nr:pentapeptide repeat-containing protein [Solirubrobacterales bacterium]
MRRLALSLAAAAIALGAFAPATGAMEPIVITVGNCRLVPGSQCQGAYLVVAHLPGIDLHGINFGGAELAGVNFAGADLAGADLRNANLTEANLRGANLKNANLNQATLRGANLEAADLQGAQAQNAILNSANARDADFGSMQMHLVSMTGADARGANFEGSVLYAADLRSMNAQGANLTRANLARSLLQGADLSRANLQGADLVDAVYDKTRLKDAATGGATIWPSNLKSDVPALEGFYEKIDAHLDAYESYGGCLVYEVDRNTGRERVGCSAKAVPGGSHGFTGSAANATGFTFDTRSQTLDVRGTDGVRLEGTTSENLGAFWPTQVAGLAVEPLPRNHGIGAGTPGGPLAVGIYRDDFYVGFTLHRGYAFYMSGWLRRR